MLNLDLENVFKKSIGLRNGIGRAYFERFVAKNGNLTKAVFKARKQVGYDFLNLPDDKNLVSKINRFVKAQQKNKWESIVVLGIGGSALGTIAVREALLGPYHFLNQKPHLFVVDNIDPTLIDSVLRSINVKKTLFIVISKSGGTVEPMALYAIVKEHLIQKVGKDHQKHLAFVTDPKAGLLRKIGKADGIEMFSVPTKVGGRFSVLSAVSLLPLALSGVNIGKLLKGAAEMRDHLKKERESGALKLACLQYLMDRRKQKNMVVMMPYSNQLFRMGDWYRQLLAESIGKNKRTGPTPVNALGTTDQHSQLQLYNQGPADKWFIFLTVKKFAADSTLAKHLPKELGYLEGKKLSAVFQAAYEGTAEALAKSGKPNVTLSLPKIDEQHIGAFFMLFEFQVALLGKLYKVDAFNQPGVEASKKITKSLLSKNEN